MTIRRYYIVCGADNKSRRLLAILGQSPTAVYQDLNHQEHFCAMVQQRTYDGKQTHPGAFIITN
jgi:hypothetical protein